MPLNAYEGFSKFANGLIKIEKEFYNNCWTKEYVKTIEKTLPNDENFLINL